MTYVPDSEVGTEVFNDGSIDWEYLGKKVNATKITTNDLTDFVRCRLNDSQNALEEAAAEFAARKQSYIFWTKIYRQICKLPRKIRV